MPYDPSKPYTVESAAPKYDPTKPFTVESAAPEVAAPEVAQNVPAEVPTRPSITSLLDQAGRDNRTITTPDASSAFVPPADKPEITPEIKPEIKPEITPEITPENPLAAAYKAAATAGRNKARIQFEATKALTADKNFNPVLYLKEHPETASDEFHFKTILDVYKARVEKGLSWKGVWENKGAVWDAGADIVEGAGGYIAEISNLLGLPILESDKRYEGKLLETVDNLPLKKMGTSTVLATGALGNQFRTSSRKIDEILNGLPKTTSDWEDRIYSDVKYLNQVEAVESGDVLPGPKLVGEHLAQTRKMVAADPVTGLLLAGAGKLIPVAGKLATTLAPSLSTGLKATAIGAKTAEAVTRIGSKVIAKVPDGVASLAGASIGYLADGPTGAIIGGVLGNPAKGLIKAAVKPLVSATSGKLNSIAGGLGDKAFVAENAARTLQPDSLLGRIDRKLAPISRAGTLMVPVAALAGLQETDEAAAAVLGFGGAGVIAEGIAHHLPTLKARKELEAQVEKVNRGFELQKEINSGTLADDVVRAKQAELDGLGITMADGEMALGAVRLSPRDAIRKFPALESEFFEPRRKSVESSMSGHDAELARPAIREVTDSIVLDRPIQILENGKPKTIQAVAYTSLDGKPAVFVFDTSLQETAIKSLTDTPEKLASAKSQNFVDDAGKLTKKGEEHVQARLERFIQLQRVEGPGGVSFVSLTDQFAQADKAFSDGKASIATRSKPLNDRLNTITKDIEAAELNIKEAPEVSRIAKLSAEYRNSNRRSDIADIRNRREGVHKGGVLTKESLAEAQLMDAEIAKLEKNIALDQAKPAADLLSELKSSLADALNNRDLVNKELEALAKSIPEGQLVSLLAAVDRLNAYQDLGVTKYTPGKPGIPASATSVKPIVKPLSEIRAAGRLPGWSPLPPKAPAAPGP